MQLVRLHRHTAHPVFHLSIAQKGSCTEKSGSRGTVGISVSNMTLLKLQVNSKYVAEDLVADFDAGLEYAEAECLLDVQHRGDSRQYLVR